MEGKTYYHTTYRVDSGWHWRVYYHAGGHHRITVTVGHSEFPLATQGEAETLMKEFLDQKGYFAYPPRKTSA